MKIFGIEIKNVKAGLNHLFDNVKPALIGLVYSEIARVREDMPMSQVRGSIRYAAIGAIDKALAHNPALLPVKLLLTLAVDSALNQIPITVSTAKLKADLAAALKQRIEGAHL